MPTRGISNFADSDMEDNSNFFDENSMVTVNKPSASPEPPKKKGGRPKAAANRVTKSKSTAARKGATEAGGPKRAKKATAPRRKALEEQINGKGVEAKDDVRNKGQSADNADVTMSEAPVSEDELESPKTLAQERQMGTSKTKTNAAVKGALKPKDAAQKRTKQDDDDRTGQAEHLQSTIPESQHNGNNAVSHSPAATRPPIKSSVAAVNSFERSTRGDNPFTNRAATATDPYANPFRRRAGSASDSERYGGEPQLRRKLGDMTRKYENVDMKYRNLREVAISQADANVERLKKQCEATTAASDKIVASLKKELGEQKAMAQEYRKIQKTMQTRETENAKLVNNVSELTTSLNAAQNEIKALQAKLAASRTVATAVESTNGRTPGRLNVPTRTVMVGSAEAAQAAQNAQLKEDLYSDLTGLIVRGVKRTGEEDTYDCIQTGRNGTLHFKLTIANEENGKTTSFEDTEFLYTPLLDSNRDRDMLELLPDYLTEEITFSRQHAAKFYSRVIETLTKRRVEE